MTKICSKCNEDKSLSDFYFDTGHNSHRSDCKKCNQLRKKEQRRTNPNLAKLWRDNNYKRNREVIIAKQLIYEKRKYIEDPIFKLKYILRRRFKMALKNNLKSGSAVRDLGCSIEEFKKHLESKFQTGMSWDNYGYGSDKWNIDHIKPLAIFDLTNRDQLVEALNYKNMQPMWQIDNFKKGAKYDSSTRN